MSTDHPKTGVESTPETSYVSTLVLPQTMDNVQNGVSIKNQPLLQTFREQFPPKHWYLPASPHGVTTQKTNIDIFTALRTSNLVCSRKTQHIAISYHLLVQFRAESTSP
jgi:hypothetical protein